MNRRASAGAALAGAALAGPASPAVMHLAASGQTAWTLCSPPRNPAGPQPPQNPPSGPVNAADQLTKLADLRDRGVLSEAEFQAPKARLLAE
jgi:hypothetical protein